MTAQTCPNGHQSGDPEWCDTCGAPINGSTTAAPPSTEPEPAQPPAPRSMVECPHCRLPNDSENLFCEQCGYDFTTGQAPPEPAESAAPAPVDDTALTWIVVVEVDPSWYELKGSLADQPCPPASSSTISLTQREALVGRSSQSRGIRPEIALDADTGVSRRHAQLVRTGDELAVLDLSSTNGTYVVTADLEPNEDTEPISPNVPTPVHDGDRVYLGAWTRLTMRRT